MILSSKTIMYTLAGASIVCALLLTALYGTRAPFHKATAATAVPTVVLDEDALIAKAAIVFDPHSGEILYEKNGGMRLPLASLTKLMSADAILSSGFEDASVVITPESLKPDGDSGFRVGEYWKLEDLVAFGLVASSNDAMAAAATILGGDVIDRMNARARELGLSQMYFYNPTGLDIDPEVAGAYGSVRDVATLAAIFLTNHPALFEATASRSIAISSGTQTLQGTSTAGPLLDIPGLIGAKTGYTDLAGGNLVVAFDITLGRPLIVAVLGSTREGRFEDVKTLIRTTRDALVFAQ